MATLQSALCAVLAAVLGGAGLAFSARQRFAFFRHPSLLFRRQRKPSGRDGLSPVSALCVALGGTIGVGNTVGVASAILLGGAGAVFWMWVSAALGLSLKYAEVYLCQRYRERGGAGGAMVLLKRLGHPRAAAFFCLATVTASLGMGNIAQVSSSAACLEKSFGLPPLVCGVAFALSCLAVFRGGIRRLSRFSTLTVPLMGSVFFLLCAATVYCNRAYLPEAATSILREAFVPRAAGGGVLGYTLARTVGAGFARGIFSNEAGLGSAPLVHSLSGATPEQQALLGSREVFLDTHVVCTLTALCILTSPVYRSGHANPATLCEAIFSDALGVWGGRIFAVSLTFFALASALAWWHYAAVALRHLTADPRAPRLYRFVFLLLCVAGAHGAPETVFVLSDLANAAMALPNLYALFKLRAALPRPTKKARQCLQFVHNSFLSYGKIVHR